MAKIKIGPHWSWNAMLGVLEYYRQQYVEEADLYDLKKAPKPDIVISRLAYIDLLDFIKLNEKGIVRTDREEDLKIIHRLFDVLQKSTEANK